MQPAFAAGGESSEEPLNRKSGQQLIVAALPLTLVSFTVVAGANAQQSERGEKVLNTSCGGCHDLRPIQTSALDKDAWNSLVQDMISKGAAVSEADLPVLLDYLVKEHGPLPAGAGQNIVLNVCTMCHDLGRVRNGRRSREEWQETLNSMLNEGAPLSDADFPVVLQY